MKEANYRTDKYAPVHKWLSGILFVGLLLLIFQGDDGNHLARLKVSRFFGMAPLLVCIWFPDAVATMNKDQISSKVIRWGGWVVLLLIIALPVFFRSVFQ